MFKDVPKGHWAYRAINKAARMGRISGFADGSFRPGEYVKREQMAQMFVNVPYTWGAISNYIKKATVYITKGYSHGSGAVLEDGWILTAKHVAFPQVGQTHPIRFYDGRTGSAVVKALHPNADLALLKMQNYVHPHYLDIADELNVFSGDEIMTCGHPGKHEWKVTKQGAEIIREQASPSWEFDADLATSGGNSGGPVVDQCCDLIGILVQSTSVNNGYEVEQGMEAINITQFKDWIAQNMK